MQNFHPQKIPPSLQNNTVWYVWVWASTNSPLSRWRRRGGEETLHQKGVRKGSNLESLGKKINKTTNQRKQNQQNQQANKEKQPINHPSKWHDLNPKECNCSNPCLLCLKKFRELLEKVKQSWRFISCSDDADGRQPMKHKGSDLEGPRGGSSNLKMQGGPQIHS